MKKLIIMGAGGRDFHNFNVAFRDDPDTDVVAFTATQIPGIAGRTYPPALAGPRYPEGIPIRPEDELVQLVHAHGVDEVVLAYSDLRHETVMHKASLILSTGADFRLMGPDTTMLHSRSLSLRSARLGPAAARARRAGRSDGPCSTPA